MFIIAVTWVQAPRPDSYNFATVKQPTKNNTDMKKDLGPLLALYPMPATVVGAESNGKVNWLMVAHVGIIGHDRLMVSMHKAHHTNQW